MSTIVSNDCLVIPLSERHLELFFSILRATNVATISPLNHPLPYLGPVIEVQKWVAIGDASVCQ